MSENDFETGGAAVLNRGQVRVVRLTGLAGVIIGIAMVLVAIAAWIFVSAELRSENITISDDAPILAGQQVGGPISAYVQAEVIRSHSLDMAGGKTFAELDREDPLRATVMNGSFLRASLFTSVISYGLALLAMGVGVMFILFGWSLRTVIPPLRKTS
ncbi:aromatic ring-opening dioxygenase LigA [Agromyces protaetiae]|uniref:Aromatic ring-opening dioxygenase LigA n=1 Tax=Agromyces protaetiae TaxID=2509455 RepID=A0A4P6F9B9_9MICO|nr:aromatic ring-opening dioxygenase LigA [Agromyces protaetiae]QAY72750.1 aromatic ring-opening dioxygenase LigA [Agromyces protaetiae]